MVNFLLSFGEVFLLCLLAGVLLEMAKYLSNKKKKKSKLMVWGLSLGILFGFIILVLLLGNFWG